jgi:hypothetical protein
MNTRKIILEVCNVHNFISKYGLWKEFFSKHTDRFVIRVELDISVLHGAQEKENMTLCIELAASMIKYDQI